MKISILLILFCYGSAKAQEEPTKNQLFFELLGHGGLYSLNYERFIKNDISLRVGFTYWEMTIFSTRNYWISPILVNKVFGASNHKLELGAGADFLFASESGDRDIGFLPAALLGYRYNAGLQGWVFRAAFTPFYDTIEKQIVPLGGISIGMTF